MHLYRITCKIKDANRDTDKLDKAIKSCGNSWASMTDRVWLVVTDREDQSIRQSLAEYLQEGDSVDLEEVS